MKRTLKTIAAITGAAAILAGLHFLLKLIGALMIHISETFNVPL